jgi:hypothetical protein
MANGKQCDDAPAIHTGLARPSSLPETAKGSRTKAPGRGGQIRERFVV